MIDPLIACRLLKDAKNDLQDVIGALVAADPHQLQHAQKLLEQMVNKLGSIEACCRVSSPPPVREALQGLRTTFGRVRALSTAALTTVERQSALSGVSALSVDGILQVDA